MNTVLRAFILFVLLLTLALLLGQAGTVPIPVSLTLGSMVLQTTAPVAITLAVAVLLAAFYFGRLTGWMLRLSGKFLNRRKSAAAEDIADAYADLALHDLPAAARHVAATRTDTPALADLLTLIHLHTATLTPVQANAGLGSTRLAAVSALYLARHAAAREDWAEVRRVTALGRQQAPQNLPLLALQFKALVNLNDPEASSLLPALKSHLGPHRHKLLTQVVNGPNAVTARPVLDSPWVHAMRAWLPTPSDTFPPED